MAALVELSPHAGHGWPLSEGAPSERHCPVSRHIRVRAAGLALADSSGLPAARFLEHPGYAGDRGEHAGDWISASRPRRSTGHPPVAGGVVSAMPGVSSAAQSAFRRIPPRLGKICERKHGNIRGFLSMAVTWFRSKRVLIPDRCIHQAFRTVTRVSMRQWRMDRKIPIRH